MKTVLAIILGLIFVISIINALMSGNSMVSAISLLTIALIICTMAIKFAINDEAEYIVTAIRKVKEAVSDKDA